MSSFINPTVKKVLAIGFAIVFFLTVSFWAISMPWPLERQLLVIMTTAAVICIVFVFVLAYRLKQKSTLPDTNFVINQELFFELYQNSPVPYIRTNNNGEIIDVNVAGVRLFGETVEELIGRNIFNHLSGDEKTAAHVARIPSLVASGSFVNDQEALLTRYDEELRWVMLSAFPYAQKRESLVTMVDITKQKNVDTAKSEFVSMASHQLRTPISSIKWNMELLTSPRVGYLNDEQKKLAAKVARGAERMGMLVDDFLDASKLEMGTFETEPGEVVLAEFIDAQLEEFDAKIASKKLTINKQYGLPGLIMLVDKHLLRMSITNITSNAIKYTPEGGSVTIGYEEVDNVVHIAIIDTGMGIPEADQDKLFSKFFRASNTKESAIDGTGIGLYIVRQAVKKMGGTLSFGSKEGVGTKFVISLPL